MEAIITDHAWGRIEERVGMKRAAAQSLANHALKRGIRHVDTHGSLRQYLDGIWSVNRTANNIRVHGEFIYIFDKNVLVTMWRTPEDLRKITFKIKKKEETKMLQNQQAFNPVIKTTVPPVQAGTTNATLTKPTTLVIKPAKDVKVDVVNLFKAIEHETKLSRVDLAKKLNMSINPLNEIFEGKSKKIGPFLEGFMKLVPEICEAYQKVHHNYTENVQKNAIKREKMEQLMSIKAQVAKLEKELQAM